MRLLFWDWVIFATFVASLIGVSAYAGRYSRSVSDFLAANRCAGRYLLTVGEGITAFGAMSIVANFEKFYEAGFAAGWWGFMLAPLSMVVALTGWVVYRYRQTKALTMAQFFEMRYSRKFRIYAGILAWLSGIFNYGIAPGIAARCLAYFTGMPDELPFFGVNVPTIPLMTAVILGVALWTTLYGGFLTVLLTDFLQAQFFTIVFLVGMIFLLFKFPWDTVAVTLEQVPAGKSLVNPFDQAEIESFNLWFFMIFAFKIFYNCMGWQSSTAYNSAAKSPHEAKMARVLSEWRGLVTYLLLLFIPICAYVVMHNPAYASVAEKVTQSLSGVSDPQVRHQMLVPTIIGTIFPTVLLGLFCAAIFGGSIGSDNTALHAWGSIFIQDIIMPFRSRPLTPRLHLNLLRCSIVGVAVFAFLWSTFFPLRDFIFMYMLITGTVYLGGSGAVIIGGLYWRRGTTAGAWAAMTAGCLVAVVGVGLQTVWSQFDFLLTLAPRFPINGAWLAMTSYATAIVAYVIVSLATCRKPFPLDELLCQQPKKDRDISQGWRERVESALGFTREFTRGDRWIYYFKIGWTLFFFAIFVVGCSIAVFVRIPDSLWIDWWYFKIILTLIVGIGTVVWFLWGGICNLRELFQTLSSVQRDQSDDGWVTHEGVNTGEKSSQTEAVPPATR